MNKPLLSICIPTYNRAEYLEKSLDSLVNQESFSQIEVVISDNCSTDGTQILCERFCKEHANIHYYRNAENIHDRNFPTVLMRANGVFRKLYNDNMIHFAGELLYLLTLLEKYQKSRPFLFFLHGKIGVKKQKNEVCEFQSLDQLVLRTSHHFTWISAFGFWEEDCVHFDTTFDLCDTKIWQSYTGLKNADERKKIVIVSKKMIDWLPVKNRDYSYGLYTVFFTNFPELLGQYVDSKKLSAKTLYAVRKHLLFNLAGGWIGNAGKNTSADFGNQSDFMKLIFADYRKEWYYPAFRIWREYSLGKKKLFIGMKNCIGQSFVGRKMLSVKRKLNLKLY